MINKLKKVKIADIIGIGTFLIVFFPAILKKIYLKTLKKQLWLVCETKKTARDNGYSFYKYMKLKHPEIKCYYVIDKKSDDYKKVEPYGNVINWGSFKHYFYYMSATRNISSHKEGNPNHALFTFMHLYLGVYNNRVFLQHGVLYQDFPMFYKKNTKFKLFICGAKGEYDLVKEKYGYDNDEVQYTGLARFDGLYECQPDKKIIALIPTWRRWIDSRDDFQNSEYYKHLQSLINNLQLKELLEKEDKYLYFYPHISTQKFIDLYTTNSDRIKILRSEDLDIQYLLKKGSLLITDYSSVFTDFSYMVKPVIYYQYDYDEFYNKHYNPTKENTCFDFSKNGFGDVLLTEEKIINKLEYYIINNYKLEEKYLKRINKFFSIRDNKNCDRIFKEILNLDK